MRLLVFLCELRCAPISFGFFFGGFADLGSRNGTFLNGVRLSDTKVVSAPREVSLCSIKKIYKTHIQIYVNVILIHLRDLLCFFNTIAKICTHAEL